MDVFSFITVSAWFWYSLAAFWASLEFSPCSFEILWYASSSSFSFRVCFSYCSPVIFSFCSCASSCFPMSWFFFVSASREFAFSSNSLVSAFISDPYSFRELLMLLIWLENSFSPVMPIRGPMSYPAIYLTPSGKNSSSFFSLNSTNPSEAA